MANRIPVKAIYSGSDVTSLGEFASGDTIDVSYIASATITGAKLVNDTITATQIAANAIGASELADNAVDTAAIAADAVTVAKLNLISTSSTPSIEARSDGTTDGYIQLNCTANSHGIKLKSPPHSAGASYTLTFPNDDGNANQKLTTNGSGVLTWTDDNATDSTKLPLAGGTMTGNIAHASHFTLDVGGNIYLDADGGNIVFQDNGTSIASLTHVGSGEFKIESKVSDKDMLFRGNDGGTYFTALTLDMSEGGDATFAGDVIAYGTGGLIANSTSHAYVKINSSAASTASWLAYEQGGTGRWHAGVEGGETKWQLYANSATRFSVTQAGAATAASFHGDGSALTGIVSGHPTTVSTSDPTFSVNGTTALGDLWINKVSGECYVCTDITSSDNVWKNIGDGTGSIHKLPLLGSTDTVPAASAAAIDADGSWIGDGFYYITTSNGTKKTYCVKDNNGVYMVIGKFAADACITVLGTISTSDTTVNDASGTLWSCNFGNTTLNELRFIGVNSIEGDWKNDRNIDFIHGFPGTENLKTLMAKMGSASTFGGKFGYPTSYAKDGRGRWHNTVYANHRMSDATMSVTAAAFTSAGSFNMDPADDAKFTAHHTATTSGQDTSFSVGFGNDDNVVGFSDEYPGQALNMSGGRDFNTAVYVLMR